MTIALVIKTKAPLSPTEMIRETLVNMMTVLPFENEGLFTVTTPEGPYNVEWKMRVESWQ